MMTNSDRKIAVYAGTFDPITNGHVDVIHRALNVFDALYVAVAENSEKESLFSHGERLQLVEEVIGKLDLSDRVTVSGFSGLLVNFASSVGARVLVRGLRAVSDYEYETQMAFANRRLADDIETIFLVTSENCSFISSSIVKNVARNGGDVCSLVPEVVATELKTKF